MIFFLKKYYKFSVLIIFIILFWLGSLFLVYLFTIKDDQVQVSSYKSPIEHDTIVKAFWILKNFQLYIKHITEDHRECVRNHSPQLQ